MRTLPPGNTRTKRTYTLRQLITENLGYCCMFAFFTRNHRTCMIALRLGVTDRAVRKCKALFKAGEYSCEGCGNCLKSTLEKLK